MPKFRVKGCLKENAEDVEVIIEATLYKEAERTANKMGILVSDVLTVEAPTANGDLSDEELVNDSFTDCTAGALCARCRLKTRKGNWFFLCSYCYHQE